MDTKKLRENFEALVEEFEIAAAGDEQEKTSLKVQIISMYITAMMILDNYREQEKNLGVPNRMARLDMFEWLLDSNAPQHVLDTVSELVAAVDGVVVRKTDVSQ